MRAREALAAIDAADEEGTMGATPPGDERAGVHGHGPPSLADDIAGALQGQRQHIGFQPIYVPYWDLIRWQQAAERLQQRLAAQAPLVDAVTRYSAALAAFRAEQRRLHDNGYAGNRAAGAAMDRRNEERYAALDALDALAVVLATPDAVEEV